MKGSLWRAVATAVIILTAFAFYKNTLFPPDALAKYPWGSDTWGHLIKVEFLRSELAQGRLYPNIFAGWYNGVQLFRYYAPLPYYALVVVFLIVKDIFATANWLIFFCAVFGALTVLRFERWIGFFPAVLGAFLYPLVPDHVRVAFAEGNLPRVLATALLPATLYALLLVMDREASRRWHVVLVAILVNLIVLSHAMMGAIFAVSLTIFCLLFWLLGGSFPTGLFRAAFGIGGGLLSASWWLLPSLTGGITELNQSAVSEALAHFPVLVSFNPLLRLRDPEIFYIGFGLGLGMIAGASGWARLGPLAKALLLTGGVTALVTTSIVNPLFNALPMHHLFWPIRFTSFASTMMLLAVIACWRHLTNWHRTVLTVALAITIFDFSASSILMHLRVADPAIIEAANWLRASPGWRVATADLSRLGSAPSYLLTQVGQREQIFGWGYQGARTAGNVSSINYAMEHGHFDYAVDRLEELGVDDVILLPEVLPSLNFDRRLSESGYKAYPLSNNMTLFHKDGVPRAYRQTASILGIGTGAQNLALLFPSVALGPSPFVDDYQAAYLSRFRAIFLSRFAWRDRNTAEHLIAQFAAAGGTVLVDLTGSPTDTFAREPKFLEVYGEPIQLVSPVVLTRADEDVRLMPFQIEGDAWQAHSPQGLDRNVITFNYYDQVAVALGYKEVNDGRVWFTGLNLPFHALLTGDRAAIKVLEEVLGLPAGQPPPREPIPLTDYLADEDGYSFSFELDSGGQILVPVAAHEGATVILDGALVPSTAIDNLLTLDSPAGRHRVSVSFAKTGPYRIGAGVTAATALVLFAYIILVPSLARVRSRRFSVGKTKIADAG